MKEKQEKRDNMTQRTLFSPADVFLSWNNRDREMKDQLTAWLRGRGFSVWESDYECSGSIKESCLAHVPLCKVFVILLTENSLQSRWVKDELDAALAMEDGVNRIVPVVMDRAVIDEKAYGVLGDSLARLFDNPDDTYNVSAVVAQGMYPGALEEKLAKNVRDLCLNRCFRVYAQNLSRTHLSVPILVNVGAVSAAGDLGRLYISRRLKAAGPAPEERELTEAEFLARPGHAVIIGSGGSGKSQYLRNMAALACRETDVLVFRIACAELARTKESLTDHLFRAFSAVAGDSNYERRHFDALLAHKKDDLLLLLDGLDEVISDADFEYLRRTAEGFLDAHPNARLVFTTRNRRDADRMILGTRTAEAFLLERFSEEDIHSYARELFIAFDDEEGGERFYLDLASIDEEIKGNPLLVSQLAVIYADSGRLPGTVVEIFDIITELVTTAMDTRHDFLADFTAGDRDLLDRMPDVLRELAYRKYRKNADAEPADNLGLVSDILEQYGEPRPVCHVKAKKLLNYLERRAILYRSEFAHKMFLEYFTAVYLYEACFNGSGEVRDQALLEAYFQTHYHEPYWENVTELLLAKTDCMSARSGLTALYATACEAAKGDYGLLFKVLRIQRRKDMISGLLLGDILTRTLGGEFGPYAQLFCYVPRENLYREGISTAGTLWPGLEDEKRFMLLSLLRDVCYIFGGYTKLEALVDRKTARTFQLFARKLPESPRAALNALFCGAKPNWLDAYIAAQDGSRVYPCFFNVHAVATTNGKGFGKYPLDELFRDELGLYGETEPDDEGRYWGLVSLPYDKGWLEQELTQDYAPGMTGLILLPSEEPVFEPLSIANTRLELLMLPSAVTELGRYSLAYYGIYSENGVRILMEHGPAEIQSENGLKYAGTVRHLYLPGSLTEINDEAFCQCNNMQAIHIPPGVTRIGDQAFAECDGLTRVDLPPTVTVIGESAFDGCSGLIHATIPMGVRAIGDYAFSNCKGLTDLMLPDSVRQVGQGAFQFCSGLVSATLSEQLTRLEDITFLGCAGLQTLVLPEKLVSLGDEAVRECLALETVRLPDSLEEIGQNAFFLCGSLTTVRFGSRLRTIGSSAFRHCACLTEAILPDSITEIGTSAFSGCTALTALRLPAVLKRIDIGTFSGCAGLTVVEIPSGVRSIGSTAFAGCSGMETLILWEGLEVIQEMAFTQCTALKTVRIPDSVKEIEDTAFYQCGALASIYVPEHTRLGMSAFDGCPGDPGNPSTLDDFITILFGSQAEYRAFMDSKGTVQDVTIDGTHCPDGILDHAAVKRLVPALRTCRVHIGPGIHRIHDQAFAQEQGLRNQRNITRITMDADVTEIGPGAFAGCDKLSEICLSQSLTQLPDRMFFVCQKLTHIQLPDGLTHIGEQVFQGCFALHALTLPKTLTHMGANAFRDSGLREIRIHRGISRLPKGVFAGCVSLRTAALPETLEEIGEDAFANCKDLSRLSLPDGLIRIGTHAFQNCGSLTRMLLPPALTELAFGAFGGCDSLQEVRIPPNLRTITASVFYGCASLPAITIPGNITAIDCNAFVQCNALTRISIPGSVIRVADSAFFGCEQLDSVTLEPGVQSIGRCAFATCGALTQVILPDTVTELGESAFAQCRSLTQIRLSQRLSQIGDMVFSDCDALREIRIPESVLFISPTAFRGCDLRQATLSVRFRDKLGTIFGPFREVQELDDPEMIAVYF